MTQEYLRELREKVLKINKPGEIEKVLEYKTMYQRFKEVALEKEDAPVLYYMGRVFTYRELLTLVDNTAKGFSEFGIKYNDPVAMSMLAEPNSIIALYALDKIGVTLHMVNTLGSADEIKRELNKFSSKYFVGNDIFCSDKMIDTLKKTGVEKLFVSSLTDCMPLGVINKDKIKYELVEYLKGLKKSKYDDNNIVCFNKLLEIGRESNIDLKEATFVPNKLATIAYTSGSSGDAKACMATWERIDSMIQVMGMTELGRFEPSDKMFTTFPLWIYYSLLNMIHEPICLGVALALDPIFNPKDIIRRNKQYQFNHWLTIPPYIATMVKMNKKTDCSKWKIVLTGGSELSNDIKLAADEYVKKNGGNIKIVQGYGASEMLGSFAYCYNDESSLGSLGVPCVGNMLKILDVDTHEEVKPGEMGVGYLYSPARMTGYYGDEEATNNNLIVDEDGVVWYNSEDIIHQNEKGEIFLDDRIRRIALTFDSAGNPTKIIPSRTRKCIEGMEGIIDCEVITVPDDKLENVAIAFVVVNDKNNETNDFIKIIKKECLEGIPEYMVPKEIIFVSELPKLSNQKNDLKVLEKMYNDSLISGKKLIK